jgi:uncharacterized alpha-E superfamily protein
MLSRTADHLYWMSRYIERAEGLARLVDAHYRMSLLPNSADTLVNSLRDSMVTLRVLDEYSVRHGAVIPNAAFQFLTTDREFSGSILSCLRSARENARAVRGSLTSELWETLNATWLDARAMTQVGSGSVDAGQFVEWVKERSHLTRGVSIGTMLRDEAFYFTRIGTFLERGDSTARLLQARRRDLLPGSDAASVPDPFEWSILLRSLSAFEIYRRIYRNVITPINVADMLLLRDEFPRSLIRCAKEVYSNVRSVANTQSAETVRRAGSMHARLQFGRMSEITDVGIGVFLDAYVGQLADLGNRVASDFLVPVGA